MKDWWINALLGLLLVAMVLVGVALAVGFQLVAATLAAVLNWIAVAAGMVTP